MRYNLPRPYYLRKKFPRVLRDVESVGLSTMAADNASVRWYNIHFVDISVWNRCLKSSMSHKPLNIHSKPLAKRSSFNDYITYPPSLNNNDICISISFSLNCNKGVTFRASYHVVHSPLDCSSTSLSSNWITWHPRAGKLIFQPLILL